MCGGRGWGRGRQRPNYRGRTTRICVEKKRPIYVLREIGRHPYVIEGREICWDREERGEREGGRGVECWMGDGVASPRWWERPTRQTEGGTAIFSKMVVMEVDTSVMIILVMSWNTSTTAQV